MTKARDILRDAYSLHLNVLSPGEDEDADLFNKGLNALNNVVDELNGLKSFLFRQVLTAGTVSGASGTLGTTWALSPGDEIQGVTYGANSTPIEPITMAQYQSIPDKTVAGTPRMYAHDGLATVYFYPAPVSESITLLTSQAVADFADLDTDYSMPKGYRSALSVLVAESLAQNLTGGMPDNMPKKVRAAKARLGAQGVAPAIVDACERRGYGDIMTGWS